MLDYALLIAVSAVEREGSFERAARVLGITPSAVSQRVKLLEDRVGAMLIVRGTPCTATEPGRRLCRHTDRVGLLESELSRTLPNFGRDERSGNVVSLRIAVSADSLSTWFMHVIEAEAKVESDRLFNIIVDDQENTSELLKKGDVLAAVTANKKSIQGFRSLHLGSLVYRATANPEFVSTHFANGVTPEALAKAPSLRYGPKDMLQEQWVRQATGAISQFPYHVLPSTRGFIDACLAGIGWGMNPSQLVDEHVAAGRLIELIPGTSLKTPLYWQYGRISAEILSSLTRRVVRVAKKNLLQEE